MRHYSDQTDDDGYRACLFSDEEETLIDFADWLEAHDIGFTHNVIAVPELTDFTIWTHLITDASKVVLIKLTFGGR